MAIIEGDIDLTQNLDFYRKKPQKLLPANVKFRSRKDIEKDIKTEYNKLSDSIDSLTTSWNLYYNYNEPSATNITINNSYIVSREIESRRYTITEYNEAPNGSDEPLFTSSNNNIISEDISDNITTVNISYNNSSTTYNNSITRYWRVNIAVDNMNDYVDSWTRNNMAQSLKTKYKTGLLNSAKKFFDLWYGRPKFQEKDSLELCRCYNCNAMFLSPQSKDSYSDLCRSCFKEKQETDKFFKFAEMKKRYGSRVNFRFNHINHSDDYDCYDGVPWETKRKEFDRFFEVQGKQRRFGIPWFQDLQFRIYDDYIEELREGEKDYSSYLTNMGWIGISRQRDDDISNGSMIINNIGETHLETISINDDPIEPSPRDIRLVESDEDLISRSNNLENRINTIINRNDVETWLHYNDGSEEHIITQA